MRAKFGPRSLARNSLPLWYVFVQGGLIYLLLLLFPHILLRIQVEGNLISLGTTHSKENGHPELEMMRKRLVILELLVFATGYKQEYPSPDSSYLTSGRQQGASGNMETKPSDSLVSCHPISVSSLPSVRTPADHVNVPSNHYQNLQLPRSFL